VRCIAAILLLLLIKEESANLLVQFHQQRNQMGRDEKAKEDEEKEI
jgi:hypothetical protein